MRFEEIMEEINDSFIKEVSDYLAGEKNRRGEPHVRFIMIMLIDDFCGIHSKGVEAGYIDYTRYNKEMTRREKYWAKVRAGEIIDTRKGFDRERAGKIR